MEKMINTLQHYTWGSKDALTRLYGITDPNGRPMAELWMGAHPKSNSRVQDAQGNEIALHTLITCDPQGILGRAVAERFGELPFLFK
ncbi:mannose-6-phosphate isomerase, partial [Sodalis-like endosymbiont of Proechinophthirus fluctus]|uniref:type I phosphomannose isomerase catalytic subunit n=1 Tax=Sodalis-like endosymbiont of Proechinophthirus fluctus TaxID=1462730 RepID=UPI0007A8D1C8